MKTFIAIVERDSKTNLYVGYLPGSLERIPKDKPCLDECRLNLRELIEMLLKVNIGLTVKEMKCSNRNQVA